jgi:hypothetical protein
MFKGVLISLFTVSLVAMWGSEANAFGHNVGGEGIYWDWTEGSEICSVTVSTKAPTSKSSTTSLGCGQVGCDVTCQVSGTVPAQTVLEVTSQDGTTDSGGKFCTPGNDACGILGFVFCRDSTTGEIDRIPLTLTQSNASLPLSATGQITGEGCLTSKTGVTICQTSIEVDPDSCPNCCPKNSQFVTFTAQAFFGEVTVCPSNSGSAQCVSLIDRCVVDPELIRFGKSAGYFCAREQSIISTPVPVD